MNTINTCGSWTVSKRTVGKRPATVVLDAERNEVCEVYAHCELIAAAPELLAALDMLIGAVEQHCMSDDPDVLDELNQARAAYQLATGEAV